MPTESAGTAQCQQQQAEGGSTESRVLPAPNLAESQHPGFMEEKLGSDL